MINNKLTRVEQRFSKKFNGVWGDLSKHSILNTINVHDTYVKTKNAYEEWIENWKKEQEELQRAFKQSVDEFVKIFTSYSINCIELVERGLYRIFENRDYTLNLAFTASTFKISVYSKIRNDEVALFGGKIYESYTNFFKQSLITKYFDTVRKIKSGKTPEIIKNDFTIENILDTLPGD
jgi:hypothetical protein